MDTRALDKRGLKRTKMVLGLRLSLPETRHSDLLVHTLDISSSGAKIGAVRELIKPGSLLIVQRKHVRAQGSVMWSRTLAPGEIQIGIEFRNRDAQIWGFDLNDEECAGIWMAATER